MRSSLDYLQFVRQFELEPEMIQAPLADWGAIEGRAIEQLNRRLYDLLTACQECFHPTNRPAVQIYAAPLNPRFNIDAFCNLRANVATIVIDPGRVEPEDWLAVVAHEYAHVIGGAGHSHRYARMLAHLCLGLGLGDAGVDLALMPEAELQSYPPVRSQLHPSAFWRVTDYFSIGKGDKVAG